MGQTLSYPMNPTRKVFLLNPSIHASWILSNSPKFHIITVWSIKPNRKINNSNKSSTTETEAMISGRQKEHAACESRANVMPRSIPKQNYCFVVEEVWILSLFDEDHTHAFCPKMLISFSCYFQSALGQVRKRWAGRLRVFAQWGRSLAFFKQNLYF